MFKQSSGQRIFTKGRIAGGIFMEENLMWHWSASAAGAVCGIMHVLSDLYALLPFSWYSRRFNRIH